MTRIWLLLLALVPVADLVLLIELGRRFGGWPVFGYALLMAIIGFWLAKSQGLHVLRSIQADIAAHRVPSLGVVDGLMVLIGGVLLVWPGVITDVLGLLFLIPASRNWVKAQVRLALERRVRGGAVRMVSRRLLRRR